MGRYFHTDCAAGKGKSAIADRLPRRRCHVDTDAGPTSELRFQSAMHQLALTLARTAAREYYRQLREHEELDSPPRRSRK